MKKLICLLLVPIFLVSCSSSLSELMIFEQIIVVKMEILEFWYFGYVFDFFGLDENIFKN